MSTTCFFLRTKLLFKFSMCILTYNIYILGVINALKKKHKVENSILSVRRHIPPKKYPNKVLIKEIPEDVSGELLCNHIEAKTKLDVEKVELSEEDPGKAILTFTTNIGKQKFKIYSNTFCKVKKGALYIP